MSLLRSKPGQAISLATTSLALFSFQGCETAHELPTIEAGKMTAAELNILAEHYQGQVIVKGKARFVGVEESPFRAGFPATTYQTNAYVISGPPRMGYVTQIKVYTERPEITFGEGLVRVVGLLNQEGKEPPCVAGAFPYPKHWK